MESNKLSQDVIDNLSVSSIKWLNENYKVIEELSKNKAAVVELDDNGTISHFDDRGWLEIKESKIGWIIKRLDRIIK